MCGIYGEINFSGFPREKEAVLESLNTLSHRGPDDFGIYQNACVTLAHRRLSIIDLSTGHQPISNEDQSIWCVCNGEIYNFLELTEFLKSKGHIFSTKSDSEVIIHLYEEYQEKCIERLNGIFAFAIWDNKHKKLILARDQLGVKPLFYYHDHEKLLFASEIKAVIQHPHVKREIDEQSLYYYFSLNYIPSPSTAFKNIVSLQPGQMLTLENEKIRTQLYWDFTFDKVSDDSMEKISQDLKGIVESSVKQQLVSDVPVGAFLSGGLDSSLIAYLANKYNAENIKTFNVRFKEGSYDESSYAKLMAKKLNTEHFEIFCEAGDYKKYLPDIVWHADNLTADVSMIPLYLVSKLAHQHVKVVLAGDGADELFLGYPTYQADQLMKSLARMPDFLKFKWLPKIVNNLPVSNKKMSFEFKAKRFVQGLQMSFDEAHCSWRNILSDQDKSSLLSYDFLNAVKKSTYSAFSAYYQDKDHWERLSRHQYVDIKTWMVDSILTKVDTMSMAHALEVRVPFLNSELVKFAAKIPVSLKLHKSCPKYILKKSFQNEIPNAILNRAKAGFNIPIGKWFRHELKDLLLEVLSDRNIGSINFMNPVFVKGLVKEHLDGKKDHGYKLISLMHFVLWYDRFIKK